MRNEYHALRQVGALTVQDSDLSQDNILQTLTDHQHKLAREMNQQLSSTMQDNMQQIFHAFQFRDDNDEHISPPATYTANSVFLCFEPDFTSFITLYPSHCPRLC